MFNLDTLGSIIEQYTNMKHTKLKEAKSSAINHFYIELMGGDTGGSGKTVSEEYDITILLNSYKDAFKEANDIQNIVYNIKRAIKAQASKLGVISAGYEGFQKNILGSITELRINYTFEVLK